MIVIEQIDDKYVRIYSDDGKKIKREFDDKEFSEAIQKANSHLTYIEIEQIMAP